MKNLNFLIFRDYPKSSFTKEMYESYNNCIKIQEQMFDVAMREVAMVLGESFNYVNEYVQDLISEYKMHKN